MQVRQASHMTHRIQQHKDKPQCLQETQQLLTLINTAANHPAQLSGCRHMRRLLNMAQAIAVDAGY
jgi:hypothetical protein